MRFEDFRARRDEVDPELDRLTHEIIGAAIEVHRLLGHGLKEGMDGNALCREFDLRGVAYQREHCVEVAYKDAPIGLTRIDLIVEGKVIIELKACDSLNEIHRAQILCYLRLTKLSVGLLINFNVTILKDGVKRVVLSRPD
jgi:GxxExxY protein